MWKHRSEHPFFSPGTTCMMSEDDNSIKAMVVAVVVEVVVVVAVEGVVAVAVVVPIANGSTAASLTLRAAPHALQRRSLRATLSVQARAPM